MQLQRMLGTWNALQDAVAQLMDSSQAAKGTGGGNAPQQGIRQRLERKEGLFRCGLRPNAQGGGSH
jgi:DNA-directed RNA polymerase beta' subunit